MRQILATIILLFSVITGAKAQADNAMYVYRNDGVVNAFKKYDIDSVRYSQLDLDSLLHSEYVVQEVWTIDSVYRIPLEKIDSVSFVTPATVLHSGVVDMEESLWNYVISSEELSFVLSSDVPSYLIPGVGQKLVYTKMDEKFPTGFIGEVSSVTSTAEGLLVSCDRVSLEDVFETYYSVTSVYGYSKDGEGEYLPAARAIDISGRKDFSLDPIEIPFGMEVSKKINEKDLAIKGGCQLDLRVKPQFHVSSTLIVNKEMGTYVSACITGDLTVHEKIALYGGLDWTNDHLAVNIVKIPVAPGTFFYIRPGVFVNASAVVGFSADCTQRFTFGAAFDFSSKGQSVLKPTLGGRLVSHSMENAEGFIDGRLATGFFAEIGLTWVDSKIDKLCFRGELGREVVSHAVLYNSEVEQAQKETSIYERFKQSKIENNLFVNTSVVAELGPWGVQVSLPWNMSDNLHTWDMVPTFSNVSLRQNAYDREALDAYAEIQGDCFIPVGIGLTLMDKNMNSIDSYYFSNKFDNGNKKAEYTFTNVEPNDTLTLYTNVNLLGFKMLASPSEEFVAHECAVQITDFEVTNSVHQPGAFTNKGKQYSYKFDVATTVTLDEGADLSQIEDWGYVYKDPDGDITHISLKSFSSPYTDTRYAYYRNTPASTVTLYGYVKYIGDEDYTYAEPKDYMLLLSCIDNNHPHLIDLGLPSGTKWSCCNVGASKPEDFGSYCLLPDALNEFRYVPSLEQFKELNDNCTLTREMGGIRYTGQNGNSIFLPMAGSLWLDNRSGRGWIINGEGTCLYWTRTPSEYDDYFCTMEYYEGKGESGKSAISWGAGDIYDNKLSIRLVSKE